MSTFCSTGITLYSKDKQSMKPLKRRLDSVCLKAAKNSDCPIIYVAETFYPEIDSKKIECRGAFTLGKAVSQLNGYYILRVYTTTPNSAKLGLWHRLIQDFYPEIKMFGKGEYWIARIEKKLLEYDPNIFLNFEKIYVYQTRFKYNFFFLLIFFQNITSNGNNKRNKRKHKSNIIFCVRNSRWSIWIN